MDTQLSATLIVGVAVNATLLFLILVIGLRGANSPQNGVEGSRTRPSVVSLSVFIAALLLVVAVLWVPPHLLDPFRVSDAEEYLTGGYALLSDNYSLKLDGITHPFRFRPFFSAIFVAPTLNLEGIGASATSLVTLYGVVAAALAFVIGLRIAAFWGGLGALLITVVLPDFWYFGRVVMSDLPGAALFLVAALQFSLVRSIETVRARSLIIAGIICGFATLIRGTGAITLIPFILFHLLRPRGYPRIRGTILLLIPTVVVLGGGLLFDWVTFGSPLRGGYQYWMSVPYDFPALIFSLEYAETNFSSILHLVPLLAAVALFPVVRWILARRGITLEINLEALKLIEIYTLFVGVPLALFYQLYFYSSPRFYLPIELLLGAIAGAFLGSILGRLNPPRALVGAILLFVGVVVIGLRSGSTNPSQRSIDAVTYLSAGIPRDAAVISGLNPLYVERRAIWGTERVLIPVSRRVEYASKVVAQSKISGLTLSPADRFQHRSAAVLAQGARDVYPYVAIDNGAELVLLLKGGPSMGKLDIFLEDTAIIDSERAALEEKFTLTPVRDGVFKLGIRESNPE